MRLAAKLVALRKQKGLTQLELAEKLNVSRQAISRWEVGAADPSIDNLKALGGLYGVPLDFLLDDAADNYSKGIENQESSKTQNDEKGERWPVITVIATMAVIILISFILLSFVVSSAWKQKQAIPIGNMERTSESEATVYTFSIG